MAMLSQFVKAVSRWFEIAQDETKDISNDEYYGQLKQAEMIVRQLLDTYRRQHDGDPANDNEVAE